MLPTVRLDYCEHRSEDLLLGNAGSRVDIGNHRRLNEESTLWRGSRLATSDKPSLSLAHLYVLEDAGVCRFRADRTHERALLLSRTDNQLVGPFDNLLQNGVVEVFVENCP